MSKNLTKQHIALLFSLYITQFLGLAFFTEAFIGILRQTGVSLENLGLIYMLGLFWVFRFLWAPFIDSISFKKLGHYRGWIIIFQSFMVIVLILTSVFDLLHSLPTVIILSILFAFFSASQDIALDALVFKTVSLKHRATANALKSSGGMIGMILGGGIGLVLYTYLGWSYTMLILSFITAISLIQILFYKEPSKERSNEELKINFKQYIHFWQTARRKKWLLFLIIYPVTISSAFGLITPMLVDLKWELDKIGFIVHILGYGIGVMASFITSWLIIQYGKKNILIVAAMGQVLGVLLLLLLAYDYDNTFIVIFVVGFIFSFYSPASVVMTTLMMDESSPKTPASQFAIQHSLYMFSGIFFAGMSVSFAGIIGYQNIILIGATIGILAVYASFKIELKEDK
jgi:predicted MFS family arabinose efflux permease